MKRSVIGGKVMRTPEYDNRAGGSPTESSSSTFIPDVGSKQFKSGLYADELRTWPQDKALLVALGVDGDVPLAKAARNAGLLAVGGSLDEHGKQIAWHFTLPANDNELAVKAA